MDTKKNTPMEGVETIEINHQNNMSAYNRLVEQRGYMIKYLAKLQERISKDLS